MQLEAYKPDCPHCRDRGVIIVAFIGKDPQWGECPYCDAADRARARVSDEAAEIRAWTHLTIFLAGVVFIVSAALAFVLSPLLRSWAWEAWRAVVS